jgi:predicted RNase H-like HicB family nuclease
MVLELVESRRHDWYRDPPGCATVAETLRYALQQIDLAVRLTQQQSPAVGRNLPSREPSLHPTRKMGCK